MDLQLFIQKIITATHKEGCQLFGVIGCHTSKQVRREIQPGLFSTMGSLDYNVASDMDQARLDKCVKTTPNHRREEERWPRG